MSEMSECLLLAFARRTASTQVDNRGLGGPLAASECPQLFEHRYRTWLAFTRRGKYSREGKRTRLAAARRAEQHDDIGRRASEDILEASQLPHAFVKGASLREASGGKTLLKPEIEGER